MTAGTEERGLAEAPNSLRSAGKATLRAWGILTSSARRGPDFLIVGAKRGGTTSLYNYLLAHPDVAPLFPQRRSIKGIHFFDVNHAKGIAWYRSHFPMRWRPDDRAGRRVSGEASPYYLFHPLSAARARAAAPDARIVALLRDPVDRAFSHYRDEVKNGREPLGFDEALNREPHRLRGEEARLMRDPTAYSFAHEHYSYAGQGRYAGSLARWLQAFGPDRTMLLFSEDLYADPEAVYERVVRFLGLRSWSPPAFERYNFIGAEQMRPATRDRLLAHFEPHNEALATLIGRRPPW